MKRNTFFKQQQNLNFLVIDTNNIDFIENNSDYNKICDVIFNNKYEKGLNRIII